MKKIGLIILFLLVTLSIFSCGKNDLLSTPVISIIDNEVKWNKIAKADKYEVKINDDIVLLNDTSYHISVNDTKEYQISVRAVSNNGKNYSNYSSILKYKKDASELRLGSPVISIDNNTIKWDKVANATSYEVHIGLEKTSVNENFYSISSKVLPNTSIFVIAKDSSNSFLDSLASNIIKYSKIDDNSATSKVSLINDGKYDLDNVFSQTIDKVLQRQLYDTSLWTKFVEQFRSNVDGDGYGWRGEFWGKMMEGACITYSTTQDEKLYNILTTTVLDMLTTQQPNGSITSYGLYNETNNQEFQGWDMWCRNWSITGMLYYYGICKDESLKKRVLNCVERQVQYIMTRVGSESNKLTIVETAEQWGGLASSTILESICKLYQLTSNQAYYDFATHIVNCGGSSYGNQIEQAYLGKTYPYTWGAPKAGELCLFFDGVYEYYKISKIEKYKQAVINYWYLVNESEITIVGGGCTKDEQFEHSQVEQCDPSRTNAMQEFCVTIHWLNLSKDVYQLTNDPKIIDSMEKTIYNAMLCAVDFDGNYNHVFTSYNNIIYSVRSTSAGGGMHLEEPIPFDYGCCISQGSIATGLIPKLQYAIDNSNIYANLFLNGTSTFTFNDINVEIVNETNYPSDSVINYTINPSIATEFTFNIRIPSWSLNTLVLVNGELQEGVVSGEYYSISRVWKASDKVQVILDMKLKTVYGSVECANENGKNNVALVYGPLTFARDARLDGGNIFQTVSFNEDDNNCVTFKVSNTATFDSLMEIEVELTNGEVIHLVNYGHAGKTYSSDSMFTVYMPITDYWKASIDKGQSVLLINSYYKAIMIDNTDEGLLQMGNSYLDYDDYGLYAFRFVDASNGDYYLLNINTNKYLTIVNKPSGTYLKYDEFVGDSTQKFSLEHSSLMTYKIKHSESGYIISANNERDAIWLYNDCASSKQFWEIVEVSVNE